MSLFLNETEAVGWERQQYQIWTNFDTAWTTLKFQGLLGEGVSYLEKYMIQLTDNEETQFDWKKIGLALEEGSETE